MPVQSNSFDCGIYTIFFVETILLNRGIPLDEIDFSSITPEYVHNKRQEILDLINELRNVKNLYN